MFPLVARSRFVRVASRVIQSRTFISESEASRLERVSRNIPDSTFQEKLQKSGVTYHVDTHKEPGGSFNRDTQQVTYSSLVSDSELRGHYEHEMGHTAIFETARKMPGYKEASTKPAFLWAEEIVTNMLQMAITNRGVSTPNIKDLHDAMQKLNTFYWKKGIYGDPDVDDVIIMFNKGFFDPVIEHLNGISRQDLTSALPKCFNLGRGKSNYDNNSTFNDIKN